MTCVWKLFLHKTMKKTVDFFRLYHTLKAKLNIITQGFFPKKS